MSHNVSALPEWSRPWAKKRLAEHLRADRPEMSADDWAGLTDWLTSLPVEHPKMPGKMWKVTFQQALEMQAKWHHAMEARRTRITAQHGKFKGDAHAVEALCVADGLSKGWRWVRVTTPEGMDYEGDAMGHCVGRGTYDDKTIFSLRDPDGLPHCTVEWDAGNRVVHQVQGRANKAVVERYHEAVRSFVSGLYPLDVKTANKFSHVLVNGVLLHWKDLPDGLCLPGSLVLSDCKELKHLPRGLTVNGDLFLNDCNNLRKLPDGLRVEGNLFARRCESLSHLPQDLYVRKDMLFEGCISLKRLPSGFRINAGIYLRECHALTSLPSGLHVGTELFLGDCSSLTELPEGLHVGGMLSLLRCTGLTSWPGDLSIGGLYLGEIKGSVLRLPNGLYVMHNIMITGCDGPVSLPDGLHVGGHLHLKACMGLVSMPSNLRVGGNLDMRNCANLKGMGPNLHVGGNLDLSLCSDLESLPEGLNVGGNLYVPRCLKLMRFPDSFRVGGDIIGAERRLRSSIPAKKRHEFMLALKS